MTLADLSIHDKGIIMSLDHLPLLTRRRFIDLGIIEGAVVSLQRMLPFQGPIVIKSNGQSIGLRRKDAKSIGVKKI